MTAALGLAVAFAGVDALASPQRRVLMRVDAFSLYDTLDNFPLLVRISPERISGFAYADCDAGGADLSFTLEDGTLLPHEIDTWNTEGDSTVWVSLPKFANKAKFYLRWKDANPPTIDSTLVWSRANYVGVWHLNEASGDALDSSGNAYTATLCGSLADKCTSCESDLGRGRQMGTSGTGANSIYFKMATVPQATMAATFSISFWAKVTTNTGDYWFANRNGESGNGFSARGNGFYNTAEFWVGGDGTSTTKCLTRTSTLVSGVWSPFELFWNGSSVNIRCGTAGGGRTTTMTPESDGFAIGSTMDGSQNAFRGQADEIRLRTAVPDDAWRTADEEQVKKTNFVVPVGVVETLGECVYVTSTGAEFATGGSPVYGQQAATAGTTYTFTAPASVPWQNGVVMATCTGWSLRRLSDGVVVRTSDSPAAGEGTTTCIVTYSEPVELRWQWSAVVGEGAVTYYVSQGGNGSDGLSWKTAFKHPQTALDAASGTAESPATILVDDGTYPALTVGHVHATLNVTKSHVVVRSANGPAAAFLDGTSGAADGRYAYRAIAVAANLENVLIAGFGIVGGFKNDDQYSGWDTSTSLAASSGVLSNLTVVVSNRDRCNPVYLNGTATLVDSDITTLADPKTTGWFDRSDCYLVVIAGSAMVDRCVIHDIPAYKTGSGSLTKQMYVNPVALTSANAVLRNSRITGCVNGDSSYSMPNGATVYATAGTIENCTIASNKTYNAAGGLSIDGPVVCRNNVIWGNVTVGGVHRDIDIADGKTPSISYTCSSDVTTDVNHNVNGDPSFLSDYSLPIDSLIAGAGDASFGWLETTVDLAGNPRLWTDGTVTPGAYEPQGRAKKVYVDFALTNEVDFGSAPYTAYFKSTVSGTSGAVSYAWDFGDGAISSDADPSHVYTTVGYYTVKLTVTETGKDPIVVSQPGLVTVVGETCYARPDQAGVRPYDTWEKATSNIEDIVAIRPANIVVTNGTYVISSIYGLNLTWPVTVTSVEGPEKTILDTGCTTPAGNADESTVRNLTIGHAAAVVDGIGFVRGKNTEVVTAGGEIRNCRFSRYLGAHKLVSVGATDTKFLDCVFDFSHVSAHDQNAKNQASGLSLQGECLVDRCVISNYYCAVDGIKAEWGVSDNGAVRLGGTSAIRNSYVVGNEYRLARAGANAGITVVGTSNEVANCTIVDNKSVNTGSETVSLGGGIYVTGKDARIYNNVIWTNAVSGASHDVDFANSATGFAFGNNLLANAAELPAEATACVTGKDPQFVDDGAGYRITKDSPCYNAGRSLEWCRRRRQATDLDGQERHRHAPDIGCYEVQRDLGLHVIVR